MAKQIHLSPLGGYSCAVAVTVAVAVVIGSAAFADQAPTRVRYDDHQLVRARLRTPEDIEVMQRTGALLLSCHEALGPVDYVVSPEARIALDRTGIEFVVLDENIQDNLDAERERLERAAEGDGAWYDEYKDLAQIMTRLNELVAANPAIAQLIDIGDTIEGRDIWALRISGPGTNKPGILYNACQHAREWISPMVGMYIADTLVNQYGVDPRITSLVDDVEFFVIPTVNPDGYEYSWASTRLWRKNRRNNGDGTFGVDLNRNWALGWGGGGSSGSTNSQTYRGTAPFSEPETQAMRDFYAAHPNLVASIDFHAYGELVLYPWAYQPGGPGDGGVHALIGAEMAGAIAAVHGRSYVVGPVFETLYQASGGSVDWTWGDQGVVSYTIELRGTNFELPPSEIVPTAEENLEAALAMAEAAVDGVVFMFVNGLPEVINAGQPTPVMLDIAPTTSGPLEPTTATLYWRTDPAGSFSTDPLVHHGGSLYEAMLPAVDCGDVLEYYFQIASTAGQTYRSPRDAPASLHEAQSLEITIAFEDTFESNLGWTAQNLGATAGDWERGVPVNDPNWAYDPESDGDGSGQCFVTDNRLGNTDVDNGSVRLISPDLDMSAGDLDFSYYYYLYLTNSGGTDSLRVEISATGNAPWVQIANHDTDGGLDWRQHTITAAEIMAAGVPLTSTMVVRFTASDNNPQSIVEAGLDGVRLSRTGCNERPADVNGDGVVNVLDLLAVLTAWGPCPGCPEDVNRDGVVDVLDLLEVLDDWG